MKRIDDPLKIASFDRKINRGAARVQLAVAAVSLVLAAYGCRDYIARFDGTLSVGKLLFISVVLVFFFASLTNYIEIKKYTHVLLQKNEWTLAQLQAHTKKSAAKTAAIVGRVLAAGFVLDAGSDTNILENKNLIK